MTNSVMVERRRGRGRGDAVELRHGTPTGGELGGDTHLSPPGGSPTTASSPAAPGVPHPGRVISQRDPWPTWAADDVSDAGMDSFPASDPPSWGPLRVGAPTAPRQADYGVHAASAESAARR